jgi:uncharacterized protein (TIGR00725 family)
MRRFQVVVIGDSDAEEATCRLAEEVGRVVGRSGAVLVSGGRGGVMEAASRGARAAGGLTVGIVPSERFEEANPSCDIVIPTGLGWARNAVNVLAADLVVVIGGRAGTLSEIAYAWAYGKPVTALTGTGGWADRLAGRAVDDRRPDRVRALGSPAELETELLSRMSVGR